MNLKKVQIVTDTWFKWPFYVYILYVYLTKLIYKGWEVTVNQSIDRINQQFKQINQSSGQ